jgi:ankyrin repeat protein
VVKALINHSEDGNPMVRQAIKRTLRNLGFQTSGNQLIEALKIGDIDMVRQKIGEGEDVNSRDEELRTPLMISVNEANIVITDLLLSKGADVNAKGGDLGWTVLMFGIFGKNKEIVAKLIAKGADVNATNDTGDTALMFAAQSGQEDIVELLLEKGADVNAKDKTGRTALTYAEQRGATEIIKLLSTKKDNDTSLYSK